MTEPHLAQPVLTTPEKPTWWKNRKFWTVVGVILAIALAAGRFVLREHRAEERSRHSAEKELDSFAVGDCVTMSQGKSGTDLTKTGCEVDPSYTVGLHIDASAECSDGKYTQYSITIKDAAVGKLCLAKNLVVGHCYQQGGPGAAPNWSTARRPERTHIGWCSGSNWTTRSVVRRIRRPRATRLHRGPTAWLYRPDNSDTSPGWKGPGTFGHRRTTDVVTVPAGWVRVDRGGAMRRISPRSS